MQDTVMRGAEHPAVTKPTVSRAHRRALLTALVALSLAACASRRKDPLADVRKLLAPTGRLRVGLVRASPMSILGDPILPDPQGVGYDMGRALANRLEVPMEPVLFARPADVIAALAEQRIDIAFPGLSADRTPGLVFTAPFLHVEQGYLVAAGARAKTIADIDRAGMRVGVSTGSAWQRQLTASFKEASIVPVSTTSSAIAMLAGGKLDAFAADKPVLYRMAQSLPGTRVLDGRWGVERIAASIPASREAGLTYVQGFVTNAEREGLVERAAQAANVRGIVPAGTR